MKIYIRFASVAYSMLLIWYIHLRESRHISSDVVIDSSNERTFRTLRLFWILEELRNISSLILRNKNSSNQQIFDCNRWHIVNMKRSLQLVKLNRNLKDDVSRRLRLYLVKERRPKRVWNWNYTCRRYLYRKKARNQTD